VPIIELSLIEGYGPEEKRRLGEALTDAVRSVVPATPDLVTVMIRDLPSENYYRGRTERRPAPACADPVEVVRRYLGHMQTREIESADAMLAEGFEMQFPAAPKMTKLSELIEWAKPRYRFVEKTYEGFESMQSPGEEAIVYCRGSLNGEWLDGSTFEGIRFIDRFEIIDGKITRQDVWNDMAEVRLSL